MDEKVLKAGSRVGREARKVTHMWRCPSQGGETMSPSSDFYQIFKVERVSV